VRVYTGQTRSKRAIALCDRFGLGECTNRGELPPRRTANGYFVDCGAFVDWRAGRAFDFVRWERDLRYVAYRVEAGVLQAPDFIVMPYIVGGGAASLTRSVDRAGARARSAVPHRPDRHARAARVRAPARRRQRRQLPSAVEPRAARGVRARCQRHQRAEGRVIPVATKRPAGRIRRPPAALPWRVACSHATCVPCPRHGGGVGDDRADARTIPDATIRVLLEAAQREGHADTGAPTRSTGGHGSRRSILGGLWPIPR